jgi:hypothetical protein
MRHFPILRADDKRRAEHTGTLDRDALPSLMAATLQLARGLVAMALWSTARSSSERGRSNGAVDFFEWQSGFTHAASEAAVSGHALNSGYVIAYTVRWLQPEMRLADLDKPAGAVRTAAGDYRRCASGCRSARAPLRALPLAMRQAMPRPRPAPART